MSRSWATHAACAGLETDLFFPERGESTAPAKSVCASCRVRVECLEYAVSNGVRHGIWGGTSERERRRIAAARRRAQPRAAA